MAKIKLTQLLCPQRHCIGAMAFDPEISTENEVKVLLSAGLAGLGANPWCGICGSPELKFETGDTKFDSMSEALPHLAEEARQNAETRQLIGSIRRTAQNN